MVIGRANAERALQVRWLLRAAAELVFVRTAAGLSQQEVADRLGLPVRTIRRAERGNGDVRLSVVAAMAAVCGFVPLDIQVANLDGALERVGVREGTATGRGEG